MISATVALAIGSMDFSDGPHVTVGVTNHHFAPAVAADGHIFEKGVHSAGPLGNLLGIHAQKAMVGLNKPNPHWRLVCSAAHVDARDGDGREVGLTFEALQGALRLPT
jgi:hypothetical protein